MSKHAYRWTGFLLIAVCGFAAAQGDGSTIRSGPVTWQEGAEARVAGVFEVRAAAGETDPQALPRQGGACLVADLVPYGVGRARCSTDADCNQADAFDAGNPLTADFRGYCAARDGSGEPTKCWTRPGPPETHCRRTVDGLELRVGTHPIGPVNGDPLGRGEPYPDWAVYSCMAQPGHDRACGEPESPFKQVSLTSGKAAGEGAD